MTIVDMHCHILPGVDDGSKTMSETMATLKEAERQGIGAMIVTPHFHPGRYVVKAAQVMEGVAEVQCRIDAEGLKIRLYPGQECYYYSGLIAELEAGNVLTMNGTDYVLVEFDTQVQYSAMTHAVRELRDNGYRPIIAHYERYQCLYQRRDRLDELKKHDALLQLNFDRLRGKGSLFHPNPWRRLLRDGYVDFLGSDTHGMDFRPLHVAQAMDWLYAGADPEIRKQIMDVNIRLLTGRNKGKGNHRNTTV